MMLNQQVYAQAVILAGEMDSRQSDLLRVLCDISVASLAARLRDGLTPEDCKAEFIAGASLYALAALNEAGQTGGLEEFRAGDLTVKRGGTDTPSRCLHQQADMIMMPLLKDRFSFMGV